MDKMNKNCVVPFKLLKYLATYFFLVTPLSTTSVSLIQSLTPNLQEHHLIKFCLTYRPSSNKILRGGRVRRLIARTRHVAMGKIL